MIQVNESTHAKRQKEDMKNVEYKIPYDTDRR